MMEVGLIVFFKNFIKMRNIKSLVTGFAIGIMAIGIISCTKDIEKIEDQSSTVLDWRSDMPSASVINGMLHFETYQDFETYIENLREYETDTLKVIQAFLSLGVDLESEFLPNLTDYPIALALEQQLLGFISARKLEEDIINNALNNGDETVFTIVSRAYLKSVLNQDMAVKIGSRIFKFYDNGGLVIVLSNNWNTYNQIKGLSYENIISQPDVYVTNDNPLNWKEIYSLDSNGKIVNEKEYEIPTINFSESLFKCVFPETAFRVTNLSNNTIRVELLYNMFYMYEWTFADGSIAVGNPIIIDCSQKTSGTVRLTVWMYDPSVPSGRIAVCDGWIDFLCDCGIKKSKFAREQWTNAGGSGKEIRIDATIWVQNGEIGCRSRHYGKNIFGMWVPLNLIYHTSGIYANIVGTFKREVTPGNCIVVNQPFNEKQHPGGPNASWQNIIPQPGINFIDPGNLSSGHRLRMRQGGQPLGTFFGFGVDKPRLVLD